MSTSLDLDQVATHLLRIKEEHGEESFHQALTGLFKGLIGQPTADHYIDSLLERLGNPVDADALKAEVKAAAAAPATAPPDSPASTVLQAIQKEMPNCKTQAHFDLVVQAWEALRLYFDSSYGRDVETAGRAREALNRLLDLAPQLVQLHEKLEDNPEATTNRDFVDAPKQLTEHQTQRALMAELAQLKSRDAVRDWYKQVRVNIDSIVNQQLRNDLFDAIRAKSRAVEN